MTVFISRLGVWKWRKYGKFQKNFFSGCIALWHRSLRNGDERYRWTTIERRTKQCAPLGEWLKAVCEATTADGDAGRTRFAVRNGRNGETVSPEGGADEAENSAVQDHRRVGLQRQLSRTNHSGHAGRPRTNHF